MIPVRVLLENTKSSSEFKNKHGLSLLISSESKDFLLDLGPDESFLINGAHLGIDFTRIQGVVLSHSHIDHGGGLDGFCEVNKSAPIYSFGDVREKYYSQFWGPLRIPVGIKCSETSAQRVLVVKENRKLDDHIWFIKNTIKTYPLPKFNSLLLKKTSGQFTRDDFSHEGILVVEENGELGVFNSCSHTGVINTVECVKKEFPGKVIRSYVGGFHFLNPLSGAHEDLNFLDDFAEYMMKEKIRLYTGHCTGDFCWEYLSRKLGQQIQRLSTGARILV